MRYTIFYLAALLLVALPKAQAQFSAGVKYDSALSGASTSHFVVPAVLTPETPLLDKTSSLKLYGHTSTFGDSSGSLIHIIQRKALVSGAFSVTIQAAYSLLAPHPGGNQCRPG